MKTTLFLTTLILAFFSPGCADAQKASSDKKILIVYLSRTKNTKAIAEIIHKNLGGTMVALELESPYPKDYKTTVDQVSMEQRTGYLPPLKTKIDSIEKYDVVFLGFPTWGMKLPPPMHSFLKQYDLSDKAIVPFNTNAGYGPGSGFETIKELCPKSTILEGFTIKGGIEKEGILLEKEAETSVKSWLKKLKMLR